LRGWCNRDRINQCRLKKRMNKLKIELENCYGIRSLEYTFCFNTIGNSDRGKSKVYAIYAPNGVMKSSLARTFDDLSNGILPKEELYNRQTKCIVQEDDNDISKERIYVLKSEIDIASECDAITNILVKPEKKVEYDKLIVELNKSKEKLIRALQGKSKIKKNEIEGKIISDFGKKDFFFMHRKSKGIKT
jgi:hypothetical protein